jgi:YD repeat-containing protein
MRRIVGPLLAMFVLVLSAAAQAGVTTTYTYDALGRLVAVSTTGEINNSTTVAYDAAGNRTNFSVTTDGASGGGNAIVADGSFESPPQNGGYTYDPVVSGATFTGGAGVAGNGSAWNFAAAPDGSQVAFISGAPTAHGSIALSVTGLTPGATYSVRFYMTQRAGYDPNPVVVSFNGTALGTFTPASTSFTQVTTASFVASGTSGMLNFEGTSTAGAATTTMGVDAVTIVAGS